MPKIEVRIRERSKWMLLVAVGLALSIIFVGRLDRGLQRQVLEAGENAMERMARDGDFHGNGEILIGRSILPVVWIASSFTAWGAAALYLTWGYFGFSAGILLWTVVSILGWRGPFVVWALTFPQYLCYVPALLFLYIGCLRWYRFRQECPLPPGTMVRIPEFHWYLVRIILGILLYGGGIWAEIHWNPWFYEKIFTIS